MGSAQSNIDKVSGAKTENERTWAVGGGILGAIVTESPIGAIAGAREGAEMGREAHRMESEFNKAKDELK